jgi:hypothetical protein
MLRYIKKIYNKEKNLKEKTLLTFYNSIKINYEIHIINLIHIIQNRIRGLEFFQNLIILTKKIIGTKFQILLNIFKELDN